MGLVAPYSIRPKLLLQELWSRGKGWDEALDEDVAEQWRLWKEELHQVSQVRVPKCILPASPITSIEIHGFGDAGPQAYGCAVYFCTEDTSRLRTANLVMAKSRVAPVKRVTLPRLELLASHITARVIILRQPLKYVLILSLDSKTKQELESLCRKLSSRHSEAHRPWSVELLSR